MILLAIELENVGPFTDRVRIGPLDRGLNVLSAPNESGKSTALHAAARALFDRHTTKSGEIKSMQPAGTDLSPRVAVEFEIGGGRYRIEKTFLTAPQSHLKQWQDENWQLISEADSADQRVQELLQSTLPGRGATKPEHWGMLGFLWARQGEPADWPGLADEAVGRRIRASLAQVEIDPVIESLRQRLSAAGDESFTANGRVKAGGPVAVAEDELAGVEGRLAELVEIRTKLQETQDEYRRADEAVAQLEKEQEERTLAAAEAREKAALAEKQLGQLRTLEVALAAAREKLNGVATDVQSLEGRREELKVAATALAKELESAKTCGAKRAVIRREIDDLQERRVPEEKKFADLRASQQRTINLLRLRRVSSVAETLAAQVKSSEKSSLQITGLKEARAKIPAITPGMLGKLEKQADAVRNAKAQLEAVGLTVELTPGADAGIEVGSGDEGAKEKTLKAGETTRLHSPQTMDIQLSGWGRVVIRSGASEARDMAEEMKLQTTRLQAVLDEAAVTSMEAAREAVERRRSADAAIEVAEGLHAQHLGSYDSMEALQEASAKSTGQVAVLQETLAPDVGEDGKSVAMLESEEAALGSAISAVECVLQELDSKLTAKRAEEKAIAGEFEESAGRVNEWKVRNQALETQISDLSARYPGGIEEAKTAAQVEFAQAEARVVALKAGLPEDFDKLPERNRRAAIALQQVVNEIGTRRSVRDTSKGVLETLGGQGIYSQETELEEKRAEILLRRDAARDRGLASRIVRDLIEFRRQAATRSVLTPLEDRLTAAFSELSGNTARRVFLDEHLQIAGIGRTRGSVHAFGGLSQGAREQLLLCLRLAVAVELASEEPQVLILDDVLVNTDPVRQERILDVLGALSADLQILILTCHADRYRGAGTVIEFSPFGNGQ